MTDASQVDGLVHEEPHRRVKRAPALVAPLLRVVGPVRTERQDFMRVLTSFDEARLQVVGAAREVYRRHGAIGWLPAILALATAGIVWTATVRALHRPLAATMAVLGAVVTWLVLAVVRTRAWAKEHPLLMAWAQVEGQQIRGQPVPGDDELGLSIEIVQEYLPDEQGRPLLDRLQRTHERAVVELGRSGVPDLS